MMMTHRCPARAGRDGRLPHQRSENNCDHKNYEQNNERYQAAATSACYVAIFAFPHGDGVEGLASRCTRLSYTASAFLGNTNAVRLSRYHERSVQSESASSVAGSLYLQTRSEATRVAYENDTPHGQRPKRNGTAS